MSGEKGKEPVAEPPAADRGRHGLASVGVLTVIQEEFDEVSAMLGVNQNLPNSPYYVRQMNSSMSYEVVVKKLSGRGNIVSATGTRALLEDFRPNYVLLVGIAGGVKGRDDTQLADVVIADFVDGYEMRKLSDGKKRKRMEAYDHPGYRLLNVVAQPKANSKHWLSRVNQQRRPSRGQKQPKAMFGNLISGEKILGDDDDVYQREILDEFDSTVAVDMESYGVARALYEARVTRRYNPQYLVIRAVSDFVNGSSNARTRQKWKRYAAHVASAFAAEIIEELIKRD